MRGLRPNIITLAGMITLLALAAIGAGAGLALAGVDETAILAIAGTAGVAKTGLFTLAGRIIDEPPPPAYPANELPALIAAIREAAAAQPPTEVRRDDA